MIGARWLRRAEAAAAKKAAQLIETAEREFGALLPGARIERGLNELRISARRLWRRWIEEPGIRFWWRRK